VGVNGSVLQQVGKWLLVFGLVLAGVGGVFYLLGRAGLGRLPGDVSFGGKSWRVYFPVATCILVSVLLTLLLWVLSWLRR